MSIERERGRAKVAIDEAAGQVRLRYITDLPGQPRSYANKLRQAVEYIAAHAIDAQASVPAYIHHEAIRTGRTALATAQRIVSNAALCDEQKDPLIEGIRVAGKEAVEEAADSGSIQSAVAFAIAELQGI